MEKTRVFLNTPAVLPRSTFPVPLRYKAQLIARGTGTIMYVSRTCETREFAELLAKRFLRSKRGAMLELG